MPCERSLNILFNISILVPSDIGPLKTDWGNAHWESGSQQFRRMIGSAAHGDVRSEDWTRGLRFTKTFENNRAVRDRRSLQGA